MEGVTKWPEGRPVTMLDGKPSHRQRPSRACARTLAVTDANGRLSPRDYVKVAPVPSRAARQQPTNPRAPGT